MRLVLNGDLSENPGISFSYRLNFAKNEYQTVKHADSIGRLNCLPHFCAHWVRAAASISDLSWTRGSGRLSKDIDNPYVGSIIPHPVMGTTRDYCRYIKALIASY